MPAEHAPAIELIFKSYIEWLALGIEIFAAFLIGVAAIQAAGRCIRMLVRRDESAEAWTHIRLRLGRWLALALEFTLAADILATAVAPTWDDIGKLAAIIVLRTLLNYFLQREVHEANEQAHQFNRLSARAGDPAPAPEPPRRAPPSGTA